jgi:mxaJ protein
MRGVVVAILCVAVIAHADDRVLRVCSDPNNFPFSSELDPGFEDAIANVLAKALHAKLEYTWRAERRGFVRDTLNAKRCDVVIGAPVGLARVRTTAPYYRSGYVFASRTSRHLDISSLDDDRLRQLAIGVQLVGDDGANPPPAHALARRGIVDNVVGFHVIGDYAKPAPANAIMRALEAGTIDVAIVWGPMAGGYASRSKVPMTIIPVEERADAGLPLAFEIAVGVRRDDEALAGDLDAALRAHRDDIAKILDAWRVPRLGGP